MSEKTSVKISIKNRERLIRIGQKGETFDDVITRLLNETPYLDKLRATIIETDREWEKSKQTNIRAHADTLVTSMIHSVKAFIASIDAR